MSSPLKPGTRLSRYEVVGLLGAGAMGTVYRARDRQLGRDVALKVLAEALARDKESVERFEIEARAASALNHPNVVTVYETGGEDATRYIAMELVDGRTLREHLEAGPIPLRRLLDVAAQIADGLAAAHERGLVHRDLKPQNLMVTRGGHAKILDFGLAKLAPPGGTGAASITAPYVHDLTAPGTLLGTVAYMSPEQARGQPADFRSDEFALGAILYEALAGRRAFDRETPAETLAAILRENPLPLPPLDPRADIALRWVVERCLAKDPDDRYAATRDLARDLAHLREALGTKATGTPLRPPSRMARWVLIVALAILLAAGLGAWGTFLLLRRPPPAFQQLTFRRGTIWSARFSGDGHTIVYAAAWEGRPFRVFTTKAESPESVALDLPDGNLLAVSKTGLLALALRCRVEPPGGRTIGMLAEAALSGGTPREVQENVLFADFSPDGRERALVRGASGRSVLEFPAGTKLYETAGSISHARVSPKGDLVAFLDHSDQTDDRGVVRVVDREGRVRTLSPGPAAGVTEWAGAAGLAWHPSGREVWFTATADRDARAVWAVTLGGRLRPVARAPGDLTLHDISAGGKVLVTRDARRLGILARAPGEAAERDLSLLDSSLVTALSADGKTVLFTEFGAGVDGNYAAFLRGTDGSPPMHLGEGFAQSLSPDGRTALVLLPTSPKQVLAQPAGPAPPRKFLVPGLADFEWVSWHPDGKRILIAGAETGRGERLYVRDLEGGKLRPVTPEGLVLSLYQGFPVSPDGKWVAAMAPVESETRLTLYAIDSLESRQIPGLPPDSIPVGWSADGRSLYVCESRRVPAAITRVDPFTGKASPWRQLVPADPAGVHGFPSVQVTPDGGAYAYTYARFLSELYLVEGLR
jgi:eukaryotic-like serine/threonine-protein kinase